MRFLFVAACLMLAAMAIAQTADPGAGIPLAVADARAALISNLRYNLRLTIPESAKTSLDGTMQLSFDLKSARDPLVIDFAPGRDAVKGVKANGQDAAFTWINNHIVVPATALTSGANQIAIT